MEMKIIIITIVKKINECFYIVLSDKLLQLTTLYIIYNLYDDDGDDNNTNNNNNSNN